MLNDRLDAVVTGPHRRDHLLRLLVIIDRNAQVDITREPRIGPRGHREPTHKGPPCVDDREVSDGASQRLDNGVHHGESASPITRADD